MEGALEEDGEGVRDVVGEGGFWLWAGCGGGWAGTTGAINSARGEVGAGAKASAIEQLAG